MTKLVMPLFFLFISSSAVAQFISDAATNRPFYQSADANIQGSAFYQKDWSAGIIRTTRGVEYNNLQLKYDIYSKVLVFNVNDSLYRFTEPVKEFELNTPKKIAKFVNASLVHNLLPGDFAEELVKGKLNFYKHYKKIVVEIAAYNSVSGTKQFEDKNSFFLIRENKLTEVSLNKKNLEEQLKDKWAAVNAFMEEKQLSAKKEAGWVAAIQYYNSL